jgi:hypothetical protein
MLCYTVSLIIVSNLMMAKSEMAETCSWYVMYNYEYRCVLTAMRMHICFLTLLYVLLLQPFSKRAFWFRIDFATSNTSRIKFNFGLILSATACFKKAVHRRWYMKEIWQETNWIRAADFSNWNVIHSRPPKKQLGLGSNSERQVCVCVWKLVTKVSDRSNFSWKKNVFPFLIKL